jgi:hypothetical protein
LKGRAGHSSRRKRPLQGGFAPEEIIEICADPSSRSNSESSQVFSNPGMSLKEEFAAGSFDGSLLE